MTIKEYWNLIGREPFLVITWEPDFSRYAVSAECRMLINHKNFRFTPISDKTNDVKFLKSPKALLLEHFWLFLVISAQWGFFPKNLDLSHTTIYGSKHHVKFQKKLVSQFRENLRTDGRTDGQTLFQRTFPTTDGGPTIH